MTSLRRVMIVEPRSSGHLLVFVARLVRARPEIEFVLLTTSSTRMSREYEEHLGPLSAELDVIEVASIPDGRDVLLAAGRAGADLVVIPHGDTYVLPMLRSTLRRRTVRTRLLVMRDPRWEYPAPLVRRVVNTLKLGMIRLVSLDRRVDVLWLREPGYTAARRDYVVDPFIADTDLDGVRELGARITAEARLDQGVFWFGVTGAITRRKNVDKIVDALVLTRSQGLEAPVGLALIGPIVDLGGRRLEDLAKSLNDVGVAFRSVDRLLSNDEMNGAVHALDCVVMAYSSHSPNSTMGKARVLGTRVVAAGPPSVQRFASSIPGAVTSALTVPELGRSLVAALSAERPSAERFEDGSRVFSEQLIGFST